MKKKVSYQEPIAFFPEEIRRKYNLGEYAKKHEEEQTIGESPKNKPKTKKNRKTR